MRAALPDKINLRNVIDVSTQNPVSLPKQINFTSKHLFFIKIYLTFFRIAINEKRDHKEKVII